MDLENKLQKVCQENNIALVGPNCLGVINPEIKMNASFGQMMPKLGNIAFMSQSGALCTAVLDYADDLGIGFSKFASLGNKADVDELKLIRYLAQDEQTKVILVYAEELSKANEFISTLRQINRSPNPKPVIVLKSGRTEEGAGAIASHTGSLAGGDAAYQALFKQAGVIRADSIRELFDLARIFAHNPLRQVQNLAIVTNAGGPGVITTDQAVESGLELAELSTDTKDRLKELLPEAASSSNPVDILGDARAERYQKTLEILADDQNIDAIQVVLTPQSMTEVELTAQAIVQLAGKTDKALAASFMGAPSVKPGTKVLNQAGITTTAFPEPAAKGLAYLGKFSAWSAQENQEPMQFDDVDQEKVAKIFAKAREQGRTQFPEAEALEIMKAYKFPLLESKIASNLDEAQEAADQIGGKLAMKIVSPDILHKSDVGGVKLNVTSGNVQDKFKEMMAAISTRKPEADLQGVLLMEMAPQEGTEVILGVNKAPGLGTMVMVGLGGIYVEVLKDVSFAYAPVTQDDANNMIDDLKTSEIFSGVRGEKPRDRQAVIECVGRLAQLVSDFPEIKELDINPLLVLPEGQGAKVLDARLVLEE